MAIDTEIKIIECNTVEQAESLWLNDYSQNGWKVIKAMKVVWSWKKLSYVVRYTIKKCDANKPTLFEAIRLSFDVVKDSVNTISEINKRKAQRRLQELLNDKN